MKEVLVFLSDKVWKILDSKFRGIIGGSDSDVVERIVITFLSEKGHLDGGLKMSGEHFKSIEDITAQLDIQDLKIDALAEILEEKGQVNHEEIEKRMLRMVHE